MALPITAEEVSAMVDHMSVHVMLDPAGVNAIAMRCMAPDCDYLYDLPPGGLTEQQAVPYQIDHIVEVMNARGDIVEAGS